MSTKTLSGKGALITGGSRGSGAAIAKRLATDGAAVAITYSSAPQKAEEVVRAVVAAGGRALAIQADNTSADAVRRAVAESATPQATRLPAWLPTSPVRKPPSLLGRA